MADQDWWRGAVIYQIYPRSFCDSNGDGIGDLPGMTARLEHVAALGVDAIWICPFFVSPQRDFGYDVADPVAVDPIFGTMADFDALLARAHALGLRVLIDQVWSHTSDQHAWFRASRTHRAGARADWYVWADPSADGTPPNNWLSVFGGSAWSWEPRRRQYYLHHFLSHQPALNLHNPAVVDALLADGAFWLDRGVDGFRLDAVDFLMHDPALTSNPPAPRPPGPPPAKVFGLQRHLHDMLHPASMGVLARLRGLMERYPGTTTLGECSSQDGALARVQRLTSGGNHLHMAYTLRPLRGGFDWASMRALIADVAAMRDGWPCWSFSNHDVERAATRWHPRGQAAGHDADFVRLLMALLLSLRGSVCVYQGEELGLTEADLAFEDLRDPFGIAFWPEFRGRDGSRTPMPWEGDAPQAGFTTAARPWLPIPDAHRPLAARNSDVLADWQRFLAWRSGQPALVQGTMRPLDLPAPLVGFVREAGAHRMLCVFNLSEAPVALERADCPLTLPRFGVLVRALASAGTAGPADRFAEALADR